MREDEKIKNAQDNKTNIDRPVILITISLVVLVGVMIWFGIKNPVVFSAIRDFLITFAALLFFIIGTALAVLCFFLASQIDTAKQKLDEVLTTADGKVEELGEKVAEIMRKLLEPVVDVQSKTAGFFGIFSKK